MSLTHRRKGIVAAAASALWRAEHNNNYGNVKKAAKRLAEVMKDGPMSKEKGSRFHKKKKLVTPPNSPILAPTRVKEVMTKNVAKFKRTYKSSTKRHKRKRRGTVSHRRNFKGSKGSLKRKNHGYGATFEEFSSFLVKSKTNECIFTDMFFYPTSDLPQGNSATTGAPGQFIAPCPLTDFRQGEMDVVGSAPQAGIFSAPNAMISEIALNVISFRNNFVDNHIVNSNEDLHYDKVRHDLIMVNGGSVECHVTISHFLCVEDTNDDVRVQINKLFAAQEFFQQQLAEVTDPTSGSQVQFNPYFSAGKIPGLKKHWKLEKTKHILFEAGEEKRYDWVDKPLVFKQKDYISTVKNSGGYYDQSTFGLQDTWKYTFVKGISRIVRIQCLGKAGIDTTNQRAGYTASELGIIHHRVVTGHRSINTKQPKEYFMPTSVTYAGSKYLTFNTGSGAGGNTNLNTAVPQQLVNTDVIKEAPDFEMTDLSVPSIPAVVV